MASQGALKITQSQSMRDTCQVHMAKGQYGG